jgi:2-polyprenyl-3-methyl-5-hydroxy-6-metoxy-1,4-benzoquinol methylase
MEYYENLRGEMLPYIPKSRSRVLEIGCGAGVFLASIDGCDEKWGIEPTDAARSAEKKFTKVIQGTFDEAKSHLPKGYFDIIICNDVIEHLPNHQAFLAEIVSYLAPQGVLVGSIPNVRFYNNMFELLLEKDWRYADSGILDRTHLAFFTEKSLRRTLRDAGFSIPVFARINKDVRFNKSSRTLIYLMFARILSAISFGYFSDIRYMQFAFQAKCARHQH